MAETVNGSGRYVDWRKQPSNGGLHPFWKERKPPLVIHNGVVVVQPTEIPQLPDVNTTNFINRALAHQQQQDDRQRDLVSVCCSNGACPNHGRTYQAKVYDAPSLDQTTKEKFVGPCVTCDEWTIVVKK